MNVFTRSATEYPNWEEVFEAVQRMGNNVVCTVHGGVMLQGGRARGNTTRQVDWAIQQLFDGKKVLVIDHAHFLSSETSKMLMGMIANRLSAEHPRVKFHIEKVARTIELIDFKH